MVADCLPLQIVPCVPYRHTEQGLSGKSGIIKLYLSLGAFILRSIIGIIITITELQRYSNYNLPILLAMPDNETCMLSRFTAILICCNKSNSLEQIHSQKKFEISARTAYRTIKALEAAGIPVLMEEGKGYYFMDGYTLLPVMFSETEANALITAQQ